jgi:hypothetical protein
MEKFKSEDVQWLIASRRQTLTERIHKLNCAEMTLLAAERSDSGKDG